MLLSCDKFNNLSRGDKIIFLTRAKKCADCKSEVALGLVNCLSFESCANYLDLLKLTDEELNQTYLEYWIDHNQIRCLCESCVANNGYGYCEMPSYFMRIDENGECEFKDTYEIECHENKNIADEALHFFDILPQNERFKLFQECGINIIGLQKVEDEIKEISGSKPEYTKPKVTCIVGKDTKTEECEWCLCNSKCEIYKGDC